MTVAIDDTATKLDAMEQLLINQMPGRNIKRTLVHYADQDATEILEGIITIVNASEGGYINQPGMVAKEGTTKVLLIAHIKVPESDNSKETEDAELLLAKELKAAIRVGVPGIGFALERIEHSRQLEHPYGWFVAFLDAGPPLETLY